MGSQGQPGQPGQPSQFGGGTEMGQGQAMGSQPFYGGSPRPYNSGMMGQVYRPTQAPQYGAGGWGAATQPGQGKGGQSPGASPPQAMADNMKGLNERVPFRPSGDPSVAPQSPGMMGIDMPGAAHGGLTGSGAYAPGSMYGGQPAANPQMQNLSGLDRAGVNQLMGTAGGDQGRQAAIYNSLRAAGNTNAGDWAQQQFGGRQGEAQFSNMWNEANASTRPVWDARTGQFDDPNQWYAKQMGWKVDSSGKPVA